MSKELELNNDGLVACYPFADFVHIDADGDLVIMDNNGPVFIYSKNIPSVRDFLNKHYGPKTIERERPPMPEPEPDVGVDPESMIESLVERLPDKPGHRCDLTLVIQADGSADLQIKDWDDKLVFETDSILSWDTWHNGFAEAHDFLDKFTKPKPELKEIDTDVWRIGKCVIVNTGSQPFPFWATDQTDGYYSCFGTLDEAREWCEAQEANRDD